MELIRGIQNLETLHQSSVVSIGNFDGVHLGHQSIIKTLLEQSRRLSSQATIITFEPLAREYFQAVPPLRLTSIEHRSDLLFELGVNRVICLEFNQEFVDISHEYFVTDILVKRLKIKYLCIGDDFAFGKNRAGNFSTLCEMGKQYGFEVEGHNTLKLDHLRVSSKRVRESLLQDDFTLAKQLLGRDFSIKGLVVKGQKLGRELGFPTANILLNQGFVTLKGVYVISCQLNENMLLGVANIGIRPTVDGKENRLEAHFFNFNQDVYGQIMDIKLHCKLRDEIKFDSLEQLKEQITRDICRANDYLLEHCLD